MKDPGTKPDLNALRQEIDAVDKALIDLFNRRMGIAHAIAAAKGDGRRVYVPEREQDNIRRALEQVDPEHRRRAESFLKSLMRLSRSVQYADLMQIGADFTIGRLLGGTEPAWPKVGRVIVQGAAGAYSEQAANLLFPGIAPDRTETFAEACDRVRDGLADVAVLPLENSTAGTVDDVYNLLLKDDLYIWRSLALPIQHQLLVKPGVTLDMIRMVTSHPQALAQCSDYIRSRGWAVEASLNTAFAAEQVAAGSRTDWAAIASPAAARACGLDVLAADINNTDVNQTRFIAVGRSFLVTPDCSRISLIIKLPHTIGALASTLAVFSDSGLNLSKIQSRPDRESPWTYLFYLDFSCDWPDLPSALATLYQLSCEMPMLRLLGWYGEVSP